MAINAQFRVDLSQLPTACQHLMVQVTRPAIIGLSGPMGAGKTTFVRACCDALETSDWVNSPTYSMIQTYRTPTGNVVHIDLYRCQSVAEVDLLDIPSLMDAGTIAFIEWIEHAEFIVPDILVSIQMDGESHRCIAIESGAK